MGSCVGLVKSFLGPYFGMNICGFQGKFFFRVFAELGQHYWSIHIHKKKIRTHKRKGKREKRVLKALRAAIRKLPFAGNCTVGSSPNFDSLFLTSRASFWTVEIGFWALVWSESSLDRMMYFWWFHSFCSPIHLILFLVVVGGCVNLCVLFWGSFSLNLSIREDRVDSSRGPVVFYPSHRRGFPRITCVCWFFLLCLVCVTFWVS